VTDAPRHVHFIAIAGTGMGALAGLLRAQGHTVTGSDTGVYPPMSTALAAWGIPVHEGFSPANLDPRPDTVVIGNVVRPDNPEARAAIDGGIPYLSFPDALREYAIRDRHSIVVTGTHGKTTTTSLLATVLIECGLDPSALVGGIAANLDGSFRDGAGPHFVVEGDEYDTAFFDKTPKFLHYAARTAILTSIEFDHADIYRDLDHVKSAFRELVAALPADGTLVADLDDPNVREVTGGAACRVVGYGLEAREGAWRVVPGPIESGRQALRIQAPDGAVFDARLGAVGGHNAANALAAVACAASLGVDPARAAAALSAWRGVKRRQELRGEPRGIAVLDDFAHHPTAVRETVAAVRAAYPGRRLVAIFEPRTNTSRRAVFQDDYARAFDAADRVIVSIVPDAPIYSATGDVTERFSAPQLADALRARGLDARALDGADAILEALLAESEPGDVLLVMSNGSFDGLCGRLVEGLEART
jgi:UDP-N-acetylmuramate: L-alanyl-gamma-D-glutamyl-meso-diaminopimelate ligase